MTSITQQVFKLIDDDAIIRQALEKQIVSYKNLALYLIKVHNLQASSVAVVSAIRRYKQSSPVGELYRTARSAIARSQDIRITSNMVKLSVEKSERTLGILEKSFSLVDYGKGEVLLVIQGEQSIKLLCNDKNADAISSLFPKQCILNTVKNLAEINITLSKEAIDTPGIVAVLTTEIMLNNINLFEVMSCIPEMLFFMKQKDVVKAYEVLFELCGLEK